MTRPTISAYLNGTATALCAEQAAPVLAAQLPEEASASDGKVQIAAGDRFAVQRGVAIVPVRGLLTANMFAYERYMGWSTYHGLAETMALLAENDQVTAIVLEGDSPGGTVVGIEAATDAIAAAARVKPVHALVNPTAVSAAYWVLSQATDITMTPGGQVGSIGIQYQGAAPVQAGMQGSQGFVFRSSNAQAKNPDPSTEAGAALILARLDQYEATFHAALVAGRGIAADDLAARISATDDPVDGGATFGFAQAQARGLVDAQATRDAFYADMFDRYAPSARPASSRSGARAFGAMAAAAAAIAAT
jgi:ClpP class serine protease